MSPDNMKPPEDNTVAMPQAAAADSRLSFLDLPTEIRFEVYSYTAVPRELSFWHYRGLFMSCKQVRDEMDKECGKILRKHMKDIEKTWPSTLGLDLQIPQHFPVMQRIVLRVPETLTTDSAARKLQRGQRFFTDMMPLFGLHLQCITLQVEKRETAPRDQNKFGSLIRMTGLRASNIEEDEIFYDPSLDPNTRRIVLDTTYLPRSRLYHDGLGRTNPLSSRCDLPGLADPNSRYVSAEWDAYTISFSNGKKIVFWVKDLEGEERESTQLWAKEMSGRFNLALHWKWTPPYRNFSARFHIHRPL